MLGGGLAIQGPAWAGSQIDPGLMAMWTLDGTLADSGPFGLDLAMFVGAATYTDIDPTFPVLGQGFDFNGARDLVSPSSDHIRTSVEQTIEFLLNPTATPIQTYFQCEGPNTVPDGLSGVLYAWYLGTFGIGGQSYAGHTYNNAYGDPAAIGQGVLGRANHIAFRRIANTSNPLYTYWEECFINGVKQSGAGKDNGVLAFGDEVLHVGGYTVGPIPGPNLVAVMSQVALYDYARSDATIRADYNAALGPYYGFV